MAGCRTLSLAVLLLACTEDGPVVEVTLTARPQSVRVLAVSPALAGADQPALPARSLSAGLDRFLMRLPRGTTGELRVTITGADRRGCDIARGTGTTFVADGQRAGLALALPLLPDGERGCTLAVYRLGDGAGSISSMPEGLACSSWEAPCQAGFTPGTPVTLTAAPGPDGLFSGWTGACRGLGTCTVTIGSGPTRVGAGLQARAVCTPDFCWEHPLPQGNWLQALWIQGANEAWAAGGAGTLLRWNGAFWSRVPGGTRQSLIGLWGKGEEVFAVGEGGAVLRWRGVQWEAVADGAPARLAGIWGRATNEIWAVGDAGAVLRFDGSAWRTVPSPTPNRLSALWEGWAVGDAGTVLRFDGAAWRTLAGAPAVRLVAVHGSGPADVWIAGEQGTLLHWDGRALSSIAGASGDLAAVWAGGPAGVWIAGAQGRIFHFDGTSLQPYESGTQNDLRALYGTGPVNVWAAGAAGTLLHWNGRFWETVAAPRPGRFLGLLYGEGRLFAVDGNGAYWWLDSSGWHRVSYPVGPVRATWGDYAVGDRGAIYRWNEAGWVPVPSPTRADLYAVVDYGDETWAVGAEGTVLRRQGVSFVQMDTAGLAAGQTLHAVYGFSRPLVSWIAGAGGIFLRYEEGAGFSRVHTGTGVTLRNIWATSRSDVWVVGDQGTVLRYDGTRFSRVESGTSAALYAIDGTSAIDVWMAGEAGTVLHYDGKSFRSLDSGTANHLLNVSPFGGEVWVVGEGGTILKLRNDK
jgi:hypothetical protein